MTYQKEFQNAYRKVSAKNIRLETLSQIQHKMIAEECCNPELLGAYDEIGDIERTDLFDFFNSEGEYDRN